MCPFPRPTGRWWYDAMPRFLRWSAGSELQEVVGDLHYPENSTPIGWLAGKASNDTQSSVNSWLPGQCPEGEALVGYDMLWPITTWVKFIRIAEMTCAYLHRFIKETVKRVNCSPHRLASPQGSEGIRWRWTALLACLDSTPPSYVWEPRHHSSWLIMVMTNDLPYGVMNYPWSLSTSTIIITTGHQS